MRRLITVMGSLAVIGAVLVPSATQAAPAPTAAPPPSRVPLAAYSLIVPRDVSGSGLLVRAVLVGGVGCPRLMAVIPTKKGARPTAVSMIPRRAGATTLSAFDSLQVCEARMPRRAISASIEGVSVPSSVPTNIDSIAILGDSGCRIKGKGAQACNDPAEFPLGRVARSVVRERPDIALYLGDFFYRESACQADDSAICGGSPEPLPGAPFTDSGWGWVADVLVPMAPLLHAVPLYVVRGNHELCYRGGNGYFLLFDPAFGTADACAPVGGVAPVVYSPTTAVTLSIAGGRTLRLVDVDSANGSDTSIDDSIAALQRPLFQEADRLAAGADDAWLLTHRPIAGVVTTEYLPTPPGLATTWTSITNTYSSYGLLDRFDLLLSSHLHLAQAVQVPGLPGQVILGNAGTELDAPTGYAIPAYGPLANGAGDPLAPGVPQIPTASMLQTWVQFGYAVATPTPSGWSIGMKDVTGVDFATCSAKDRQVSCR